MHETQKQVTTAILLTGLAYFLFSVQDASIKLLVTSVSVWQVLFFRSATILVGCALIGGRRLFADSARSPVLMPMLLRGLLTLLAWLCYYTAAASLPLAELTTIYFAAPIFVTILSIVVLGERVPLSRWVAVLLGFVGVFIACDPAQLGLSTPVVLVLMAAALWGLSIVLIRKIAQRERTIIQLVLNNAFFVGIAGRLRRNAHLKALKDENAEQKRPLADQILAGVPSVRAPCRLRANIGSPRSRVRAATRSMEIGKH